MPPRNHQEPATVALGSHRESHRRTLRCAGDRRAVEACRLVASLACAGRAARWCRADRSRSGTAAQRRDRSRHRRALPELAPLGPRRLGPCRRHSAPPRRGGGPMTAGHRDPDERSANRLGRSCAFCGSTDVGWEHPLDPRLATFEVHGEGHILPASWALCDPCERLYVAQDDSAALSVMMRHDTAPDAKRAYAASALRVQACRPWWRAAGSGAGHRRRRTRARLRPPRRGDRSDGPRRALAG